MSVRYYIWPIAGFRLLAAGLSGFAADGDNDRDDERRIKHVFVIAMENHNWTQPVSVPGGIEQVYQNPAAPFINSLVGGTAVVFINGRLQNISEQVAYAAAYHNVLATAGGNNPSIHPSEPNYIWAEAGDNLGVLNDNDPFKVPGGTNQTTTLHLSTLLQKNGKSWKSYQEDIDLQADASGNLVDLPLPENQWTAPIVSKSGVFGAGSGLNEWYATSQYNYAAKHNPFVFFSDSNGGNDTTPANPLAWRYAPLQQLPVDLANNRVADYNWITPNQYNDMHTALSAGFAGLTGDAANIRQGDNFLSRIVPMIMGSRAYQDGGAIILWWDESEADSSSDTTYNDLSHTIGEIVISKYAHVNENGLPYGSTVNMTHSSDLRTMQEIFHVGPYLRDAANGNDLSDLFAPGVIPVKP